MQLTKQFSKGRCFMGSNKSGLSGVQTVIAFTTAVGFFVAGSFINNNKKEKEDQKKIEETDKLSKKNQIQNSNIMVDKYQQLRAIPRLNNNYIDSYNVQASIPQPLITVER